MTGVITWFVDCGDGVYIGGTTTQRHQLTPHKIMTTTTIQDQFITQVADEELSIEELNDINGSLGILAPVVGAFAAGYAVGTVLGKATGLID